MTHRKKFQDVALPVNMQSLPLDPRGYPVPANVMRDKHGKPHFTVNDTHKAVALSSQRACGICGKKMGKLVFFLGGPLSALHKHGKYIDGPLHKSCALYAVKVCPYLGAPNYRGRIDDATVDYDALPDHISMLVDPTVMPDRPPMFVLAGAKNYDVQYNGKSIYHEPTRPWKTWSAYVKGSHINFSEVTSLLGADERFPLSDLIFMKKTTYV